MNKQQMLFCIITLLWVVGVQTASVIPYSALENSLSGSHTLYSSSTTPIITNTLQEYIVTYPTTMVSNPQIAYSINTFRDQSSFSSTYVKASIDSIDSPTTSFKIYLMLGGSATVRKIGISYMAMIDTESAINILTSQLTTFSVINTGTGPRTQTKTINYLILTGGGSLNADLSKNVAAVYLIGFQLSITSQFALSLTLTISTPTSLSTDIYTESDCIVDMVKLTYILIDTGLWSTSNPAIIASFESFSGESENVIVTNYGSVTTKMLGLTGFTGTINNNFRFGYTLETGDTVHFQNSNEASSITYGFLMIGQQGCPNSYPYFEDNSQTLCADTCPSTHTQTPTSNVCESCSSLCSSCGVSSTQCLSCSSGYTLSGNTCKLQSPKEKTQQTSNSGSMLPLLGFLGIIPVAAGTSCILSPEKTHLPDIVRYQQNPTGDISMKTCLPFGF